MSLRFLSWLLVNIVVTIAAWGCAIYLYRSAKQQKRSPAIVSALIIGITALITGLQFVFPEILSACRRNREALLAGEWWRMVTPLFVQANDWKHCVVNGIAAIVFCPLAERLYGKGLLALYFVPGVLGEIFGYAWRPHGAGSSLGIAGVIGSLFTFTFLHRQEIPGGARVLAMGGFAGAMALCIYSDTHGPPILIGGLLAIVTTFLWPNNALEPTRRSRHCCSQDPLPPRGSAFLR
jgi:rhomboid protease GluP